MFLFLLYAAQIRMLEIWFSIWLPRQSFTSEVLKGPVSLRLIMGGGECEPK